MSLYLFVLVMEVLQMILQQFIDQDGQFHYHWRCTELKLFQLSFADDLLLLCKADVQSAASGLRDSLLETLGFQEGHLPVRYLGLPLISARLSIADCQPLLQKIDSCIKGWRESSSLCRSGAAYQICLGFLGVYWAMAFILPKGIINEMIKRLRSFLWKGPPPVATRKWLGTLFADQSRKEAKSIPPGPQMTNTQPLDKLSVVIRDGQWNWPLITDIACLEITHMLPHFMEGQDRISWKSNNGSFNTSTAYDLFRPPGPKVSGLHFVRNVIRDGSSIVVGHPRLWEILWLKSSDKGSLAFKLRQSVSTLGLYRLWKILGLSSSTISIAPAAMEDEGEEGELEEDGHGAVLAVPATLPSAKGVSTMEKLKADFNLKEFFELASRVIDEGDSESMGIGLNLWVIDEGAKSEYYG
ncbi:hypothetical protein Sango_3065100 [Sesamum angolense]|uniref:Reverse transcriptase domain-containing protein n=1 Tax=Sesamum angolense TaxID=2727404 RepID=A0AAE1W0J8_9LAMI|nr:hypothetical protein Sango_3065100 [Sesamum angolense]